MVMNRVKVTIRCRRCGEKYILRGRKEHGRIDTGFKQCLCNNTHELDMKETH
jgi:ribosomal protein L37E